MPNIQYFLGANSPQGFYSLYDQLIDPDRARAVYILKGGPGCGKSTLMSRVALQAEEQGHAVEHILCSGDPNSLDGVVLPDLGVALVDGTAPHAAAPLGHFVAASSTSFAPVWYPALIRSAATPLPTEPAVLGFGGAPDHRWLQHP